MQRCVVLAVLAAVAACAHPRTTPAGWGARVFDPRASDPKALAEVDAALASLGGYERWRSLQELRFELAYRNGGKLQGRWRHRWDRWNGRHDFAMADPLTLDDDPAKVKWLEVKYDLYDDGKLPFGSYDGQAIGDADAAKYVPVARDQLFHNALMLVALYELRDPGARLADGGQASHFNGAEDLCQPACDVVEVTFDPALGQGTWEIDLDLATHRPVMIAKRVDGGRIAFRIAAWTKAGGLDWPARLVNVALPDEEFDFTEVAVGVPEDATYERPVDRSEGVATKKVGKPDERPGSNGCLTGTTGRTTDCPSAEGQVGNRRHF